MSLSKRSHYEFSSFGVASVRNKRVRGHFSADVKYPTFCIRNGDITEFVKFSSEVLFKHMSNLPVVVEYEKHSGDFTVSYMGGKTGTRQIQESVFNYNGTWLSTAEDVGTLILRAATKYDPTTKTINTQHILAKLPPNMGTMEFGLVEALVEDIRYIVSNIPTLLDREIVPIEKPEWVDEAIASHTEASVARA
jgi:hypothetical protein